jgi:hypothetical protein
MFHFLQTMISFPVERNRKGSVGKRQEKNRLKRLYSQLEERKEENDTLILN